MAHIRDQAFSLDIIGRNEDPNNRAPLTAIMTLKGNLIVFKTNSIFHVHTADGIDPERKYPQAKGTFKQIHDIGTSNPFVSRTIIQASEILKSLRLQPHVSRDDLLDIVYDSMNQLLSCHGIQSALKQEIEELLPICDACISDSASSRFIHDFPQVRDLEGRFAEFFLSAKRFLQSSMSILKCCFSKPESGVDFRKDIRWAEQTFGPEDPINQLLRDDNAWMFLIISVRNYIEHPDDNLFIEVSNFAHSVENNFTCPGWRYKLRNHEQDFVSDLCQDMDCLCQNMLAWAEELLCHCAQKTWDPKVPFYIYQIPEERVDPQKPMRYAVSVDLAELRAKAKSASPT